MSLVPTPAGDSFDMEASSSEDDVFETPATQKMKTQKAAFECNGNVWSLDAINFAHPCERQAKHSHKT